MSLRPLRLCARYSEFWLRLGRTGLFAVTLLLVLRAIVEGIQLFKNDREASIRAMAKYLRIEDREALETYRIYQPIPFPSAAAI